MYPATPQGQWTLARRCLSCWPNFQLGWTFNPLDLFFSISWSVGLELSYYLPILIFVISSFILVSLDGWAFYHHYLSTYDIQREGWRASTRKIKTQDIRLYWQILFTKTLCDNCRINIIIKWICVFPLTLLPNYWRPMLTRNALAG